MILLEPGALIAAGYRLERPLARGGMGSVWVARHLRLDVDVAIKFMAPEHAASAEGRARFEREAKASAQLRSPYVVQVHDYGVDGDTPYIVMELLEGEDLDTRLRRVGRLSLGETLFVLDKVCRALTRAHEVGLVHRDLKPANVFLAHRAGEETVKVLDFGIAKSMDPALAGKATKTGTLLGTPYYMSPEQMRRSKLVDHRSDLWSIGVIVYQCVVGRLPFSGEELVDVLVEICTEPIPPPSHFAPDLPPALDLFIERALARDVSQRFQSAGELADAFSALVASGYDGGHPQTPGYDAGYPPIPGQRRGLPSAPDFVGSYAPAPRPPSAPVLDPSSGVQPPSSSGHDGGRPPGPAGAQAASLPSGTLAPAGHTFASPPSRGRRVGLLLGVVGAVAAVGVTVSLLVLRAAQPTQRSGVASGDPASTPAPAAPTAPTAPSSRAPSVAGTAAPAPPASSVVQPSHPPTSSSPRPPAVRGAAKKSADDPLDSR